METIFVIDDSDTNLTMAKQALSGSYRVFTLPSASKMFALLEKIVPDLILLDISMPEMDGFAALSRLAATERTAAVPVVFLTSSDDAETEARGFEAGVVDFITKPFSRVALPKRVETHLRISDLIKKRTARLERLKNGIVSVLADIVECRDEITGGHIDRTSKCIKVLINAMRENGVYAGEMAGWDIDAMVASARLHDVGKIAVSDAILNKPGKLTPEEFAVIKGHVREGEQIIDKISAKTGDEEFLRSARVFVSYHHERWDGGGYPYGLAGAGIPLAGRIMAIIDVYDALVSERPYKKPLPADVAINIIMQESGKHFDPHIAEIFFLERVRFNEIAAGKQG
ncbi:MAG: response regulator [Chitinispirillales bacterium]|jgi:putative two-component system response regulator|nr:response regulator [Chitinispirillales bacterium]